MDDTFQEFYSHLYASLWAHESALRPKRKSFPSGPSSYTERPTPHVGRHLSIMCNGQRRYGTDFKRKFYRKLGSYPSHTAFTKKLCYNSKSPQHFTANCDQPINNDVAAKKAFRNLHSTWTVRSAFINFADQFGFTVNGNESAGDQSEYSTEDSQTEEEQEAPNTINFSEISTTLTHSDGTPTLLYDIWATDTIFTTLQTRSLTHQLSADLEVLSEPLGKNRKKETLKEDRKKNKLRKVEEVFRSFTDRPRKYSSKIFQGCCVDTGAQSSVAGTQQAKAYCSHTGISYRPSPSTTSFTFANRSFQSLGRIPIRLPNPNCSAIEEQLYY